MNKSDKLFMETAEKQQKIIDVLLEACKDAKKEVYECINKRKNNLSQVWHTLQQAINQTESK